MSASDNNAILQGSSVLHPCNISGNMPIINQESLDSILAWKSLWAFMLEIGWHLHQLKQLFLKLGNCKIVDSNSLASVN